MDKILPRIVLSPPSPAAPQQIEWRRQVVEKIRKLQDEIGSVGLTVEELLDDDLEDDD